MLQPESAVDESKTWEREVRALEDQVRRAFVDRDIATLDRLWSDGFVVNSPLNTVTPKAQVLELLGSGRIGHVLFEATIEHIGRHDDLVVVMGGETVVDRAGDPSMRRRFSHVWRKKGDAWRTLVRHANIIPDAKVATGAASPPQS